MGPSTAPLVRTDVTGALIDDSPSTTTIWDQPRRKSETQSHVVPWMCSDESCVGGIDKGLYRILWQNPSPLHPTADHEQQVM